MRRNSEALFLENQKIFERFDTQIDFLYPSQNLAINGNRQCREHFLRSVNGSSILDVGCGNGENAFYFNQQQMSVTATDMTASRIESFRENHPEIHAEQMDFIQPHFSPGQFDGIYAPHCFSLLPRDLTLKTLREYYNLLKNNGVLSIGLFKSFDSRQLQVLRRDSDEFVLTMFSYTEREITDFLEWAGFDDVGIYYHDDHMMATAKTDTMGLHRIQPEGTSITLYYLLARKYGI